MNSGKQSELIVLVGPTASGKSALAARLGARIGGEVLSADSVQVYRHFNIGAGKPSQAELALCAHHLIDILEPNELVEASVFARLAEEKIREIECRGRRPIVCGGTFLWVRALLYGLADAPAADEGIRQQHRQLAESFGRTHLHRMLAKVDEKSAERLHPNDLVRVSRALEVYELSGRTLSAIQQEHGFRAARRPFRLLAVDWERDSYERRLAARVRSMMDDGFVEEVEQLTARGYGSSRAMTSVGYRQVFESLTADPRPTDEELCQKIVQVTRVFARRQRTWLRDERMELVSPRALVDEGALESELIRLGFYDD